MGPGMLFFALKGPQFNGNQFAQTALEKGAAYAVIDEPEYAVQDKTILVENVLETLQELAKHHRQQFNCPFIAITGSNGKTTTKELIHAVLSARYKTYTTAGNLNNHIGVPLTLLKIKPGAEMAVIEMGANHLHEIAGYCKIALPTHGLITNCGKAHLEGFGSLEGVRKGKGELYDYLRDHGGMAFLMRDYDYLPAMAKGINKIYRYGTDEADTVGIVKSSRPFLEIGLIKGPPIPSIKAKLVGDYNLSNVLAAAAVGNYFGVHADKIRSAIENYSPSNSRSQMMNWGTNKVIMDAYNANPASMKAAVENFASQPGENKILLLGAMAELGDESLAEHQSLVNLISQFPWKQVVLVGGDFLKLKHPFLQFENAEEAGKWVKLQNIQNSFLLVKGSRSIKMEKILDPSPI
jgi:UDP-N-acetylmuramoyl-tripeptide--D-alanyl-D-alanine ligase